MVDLNTHLRANPRGRQYSYAVRIRGMPYLWTDGRATWSYSDAIEVIDGGLGKTDFSFDYKSDPMSPLDVGSGQNIVLVDESSKRTRYLFSPNRPPAWSSFTIPSAAGITPSDTTLHVADTTGLSGGEYLYLGQETVSVTSVTNATDIVVVRGLFGTTKMKHISRYEGVAAGVRGTEISTLPTVWAGRFVDVYMAPIDEDGTAGTRYTIWAGRLGDFTLTGKSIRISCDNLAASFAKDSWPDPAPSMHTGSDQAYYYLKAEDFVLICNTMAAGGNPNDGRRLTLGSYSAAGVFAGWTTAGWYSIDQICQGITDTLVNNIGAGLTNTIEVYREDDNIFCRNDTTTRIWFPLHGGIFGRIVNEQTWSIGNANCNPTSTVKLFKFLRGYSLDKYSDQAMGFPLFGSDIPTNEGCKNASGTMLGYAKITNGNGAELVSFTSCTLTSGTGTSSDGLVNMAFDQRGLGGTTQKSWGDLPDEQSKDVKIEQVMVISSGAAMDAANFLLYLLLSVDGVTGLNDSTYDKLGSRFGLGYHPDHVDIDGIKSKMALGDMPQPYMWWVEETGKGKEALEQFMKLHGVYFVTKRFERSGVYLFGLSVDIVDVPVPSRYNSSVTDAFRESDTPVNTNINERLIINTICVSPAYEFGKKDGDVGGKVYEYAEDSINKYGASKSLDISATAQFNYFYGIQGETGIAVSIATAISLRWFGAFAAGNFTLEMNCPHIGWTVQPGDRTLLTLTGVANSNGDDGLTGVVAKLIDAKHTHGKNAGAKLTFRISLARACELAPCFKITSVAANPTVTLTSTYASPTAELPFYGDTAPTSDVLWFQASKHTDGLGLRVYIWEKGNFAANNVVRTVTSTSVAASTLTFDSPLPGALTAVIGAGGTLLGTLANYDDPTILMATYAYIGSNDVVSKLGTLDASTTDVEAFEWA